MQPQTVRKLWIHLFWRYPGNFIYRHSLGFILCKHRADNERQYFPCLSVLTLVGLIYSVVETFPNQFWFQLLRLGPGEEAWLGSRSRQPAAAENGYWRKMCDYSWTANPHPACLACAIRGSVENVITHSCSVALIREGIPCSFFLWANGQLLWQNYFCCSFSVGKIFLWQTTFNFSDLCNDWIDFLIKALLNQMMYGTWL